MEDRVYLYVKTKCKYLVRLWESKEPILPYVNGKPKPRLKSSIIHAQNPNANTEIRCWLWTGDSRIAPWEEAAEARGMEGASAAAAGTKVLCGGTVSVWWSHRPWMEEGMEGAATANMREEGKEETTMGGLSEEVTLLCHFVAFGGNDRLE
jgi:hypothetical protein